MIHNLWHSMTIHDSQPLAHHSTPWFTTSCSEFNITTHNHWLSITHHGIMVFYSEPVVVNHGVLFWASGCESCCVILSQWLWIMVCYAELVVVNHGVLCWASGGESWCVMLSQRLWIKVHTKTHNHWLSIAHHDSQPLAQHNTPWFTTTSTALHTMIHNHWFSITHHSSQPLAQYITPWFTTTGSV
jgi:hypothetical protein